MTGQSQQRFREKVRRGLYPGRVRGEGYDMLLIVPIRMKEQEEKLAASSGAINLTAERARKERGQAEKIEFELAVAKKEYVHVSFVEKALERFASAAAARFDSITSRLHQRFPSMNKRHLAAIKKEIAEARNGVAGLRAVTD